MSLFSYYCDDHAKEDLHLALRQSCQRQASATSSLLAALGQSAEARKPTSCSRTTTSTWSLSERVFSQIQDWYLRLRMSWKLMFACRIKSNGLYVASFFTRHGCICADVNPVRSWKEVQSQGEGPENWKRRRPRKRKRRRRGKTSRTRSTRSHR